jgi:hypothetical protein
LPHHRLFGLVVAADRHLAAPITDAAPDIVVVEHPERHPSPAPTNPRGYAYAILDDGSVHVSWSALFDFIVNANGTRIDVFADNDRRRDAVYTYLISQVISVALLKRGIDSLHASAVAIGDQAYVLVGESGHGKSTLTAAMISAAGARLITDDLLVVEKRGEPYFALPGATRIKLHPETASALSWKQTGVPMLDGSGKHVYVLPPEQCSLEPVPVRRILLLQPHAHEVALHKASAAQTTQALLAATFNPLHTAQSRLELLLRNARDMAACNCAYFLHVPRDLQQIPTVLAAAV